MLQGGEVIVVHGPPASGKSTLCARLLGALRRRAPDVQVDYLSFDGDFLGGSQALEGFSKERFDLLQQSFVRAVAAKAGVCLVEDVLPTPQSRRRFARLGRPVVFVRLLCDQATCEARNAARPAGARVSPAFVRRYFAEFEAMPGRDGGARGLCVGQGALDDAEAVLEAVLGALGEARAAATAGAAAGGRPAGGGAAGRAAWVECQSRRILKEVAGADVRALAALNSARRRFLAERGKRTADDASARALLDELRDRLRAEMEVQ